MRTSVAAQRYHFGAMYALNRYQTIADVSSFPDDWECIDIPAFYLLCADVIDVLNEYLDWHSQLHFRRTCRKVAMQSGASWSAVTAGVHEARRRGLQLRACDIAIGAGLITAGVVATGGVIALGGAAMYVVASGGAAAGGLELVAALTFVAGQRTVRVVADGASTVGEAVDRQDVDVNDVVAREQRWQPSVDFDVCDRDDVIAALADWCDVCVLTERQRYGVYRQEWSAAHLLPIDPPAWDCPQLGVPQRQHQQQMGAPKILHPDDVAGPALPEELWSWEGPWALQSCPEQPSPPAGACEPDTAAAAQDDARDEIDDDAEGVTAEASIHSPVAAAAPPAPPSAWLPTWVRSASSSVMGCAAAAHHNASKQLREVSQRFTPAERRRSEDAPADPDGWTYGVTFARGGGAAVCHNTPACIVRQRVWTRRIKFHRASARLD